MADSKVWSMRFSPVILVKLFVLLLVQGIRLSFGQSDPAFVAVVRSPVATTGNPTVIEVYRGTSDATVEFNKAVLTGSSVDNQHYVFRRNLFPIGSVIETDSEPATLMLPASLTPTQRTGIYTISVTEGGETFRWRILITNEDATIRAVEYSTVVSREDSVTLTVASDVSQGSLRWRRNGVWYTRFGYDNCTGSLSCTDASISPGMFVYESHETGQYGVQEHAIMNVIVRECEHNKWDPPGCMNDCQPCINGGICSDLTGWCLCPPGFSGNHCENVHGSNVFGQTAEYRCDDSGDDHSNGCQGAMICYPNPFGCTCPAGYTGLDCMESCERGKFGANCKQECHCLDNSLCASDTGVCEDGECESGYKGTNCQLLVCSPGVYGDFCNIPCSCETEDCNDVEANCAAGCAVPWTGSACDQNTDDGIINLSYVKVNAGQVTAVRCSVIRNPLVAEGDLILSLAGTPCTDCDNQNSDRSYNLTRTAMITLSTPVEVTCSVRNTNLMETTMLVPYVLPAYSNSDVLTFHDVTSTSITVCWPPWNDMNDIGDGPVIDYRIQMRENGTEAFSEIRKGTDLVHQFLDLNPDTLYEFRVILVREGQGGEGAPSNVQRQRILCDDIDECNLVGGSPCTTPDTCVNTPCSYRCECATGYFGAPYGPGQQRTCTADISPPVIEGCPSDQFVTVPFGISMSTSFWIEPTATDDSGGALMLSRSHTPGSSFPIGTTAVTYTFEDPAGNQAECIFDVIVQEDCTVLYTMLCDVNMCSCNEGRTCDSQTGRCEASCNIFECPAELPYIRDEPTEITRSTTSITISWRPWDPAIDVGDPPVVAYIPYYRMDPSQDWTNGSVIPVNLSLEFTAFNLVSDRNYTFSIAAVREGEDGEGPRGPPITIKTLCIVPPDLIPSSVSTTLTASGNVSVSWESLENVDCSTGITQFTVYYEKEGDITTRQKAGTADATTRSFIVDGSLLESGTTYNFYVTVTTDQEGALSEATEDSQLMFNVNMIMDPGTSSVYLVVLVIPFLLLCIVIVIIFRRYQKKSRTDDELEDVRDANYDNAGVTTDDPEDYIALDEKSRNKATTEYQGLSESVRYEKPIQGTAVASSIDKSQKRREQRRSNNQYEDVNPDAASRKLPTVPQLDRQSQDESEYEVPEMFNEYAGVYVNTQNVINPSPPTPIKVTDFKNFMTRGRSEVIEEIIQQFMALQSGKQHPWNAALKPQNKPKNFFKSLLPYDHSRVKLDTDGSNGSSDYINASYIKNHQGKVSFIAAQGPRDGTKDDFWKMVWQEDVEAIVMLVDKSEVDEQQYWPSKVNTSLQYGDITVLLMDSTGFRTHTVRKMNVLKGNERVHTLKQYEIPCWRYGGVPSEPADLLSVIKQIKINQERNKHLLVHCSNGVGATGTFIALYDLMDVIKTKKEVSVFDVITGMRKDRIDMVLTRLQYLFIFALLEAMLSPDSEMSCDQLKKLNPQAIKKKAKKEFQMLKQNYQTDQDISLMAGSSPENKHKNRFQNLIPMDEYRPVLSSTGILFGFNDYVNATIVKDISGKDFIMTQSPLASIVEDFWRLVLDYDCTSIVMLNTMDDSDESLAEYWPDGHNASGSHGLISVTCKKIDESEVFTKKQFQVNHKRSQKSILVDHFSFNGWTGDKPDVSKLTEFIKYTKPKGPGPDLVHCINGVGLSAVYVTVVSELERMEKEGTIDVCGTVKRLRKKCPAAIQTEEEYCLCYQLLKDHLNNPDEYAVVF